MSDTVTLREFIEQKIAAEVSALKEVNAAHAQALRLQSVELERRLQELNHAHAQAVTEQSRVLSKDEFAQFRHGYEDRHATLVSAISDRKDEIVKLRDDQNAKIAAMREEHGRTESSVKTWIIATGIIVTLLMGAIHFVHP